MALTDKDMEIYNRMLYECENGIDDHSGCVRDISPEEVIEIHKKIQREGGFSSFNYPGGLRQFEEDYKNNKLWKNKRFK